MIPEKSFEPGAWLRSRDLVNCGLISPKRLKDTNFKFGRLLPCNVPTECLKNYFRKRAWPSSRDPVNCTASSANSYKMVEAIPYTDFKFVSVQIMHVWEIEHSE